MRARGSRLGEGIGTHYFSTQGTCRASTGSLDVEGTASFWAAARAAFRAARLKKFEAIAGDGGGAGAGDALAFLGAKS